MLEGRLISVAPQALRLGTSVVLDYGLWGRDERSALRWLARSIGRHARWSACLWTRTFSSPASRTARNELEAILQASRDIGGSLAQRPPVRAWRRKHTALVIGVAVALDESGLLQSLTYCG